jgi:tetratricopeptide (TPR) repeat protein
MLALQNPNDLWIFHREEIETIQDGVCDIYVILDAVSGHCISFNTSIDLPSASQLKAIIREAMDKYQITPKNMAILKSDPLADVIEDICHSFKIPFTALTKKEVTPFVADFSNQFRTQMKGMKPIDDSPEHKKAQAFIPETYGPCPCASGLKYKFCCQKIFKNIVNAMADAQDGHINEALASMQEAEKKVGLTAEVLSRYGIVWSFVDMKKANEYFKKALQVNPNHPRTNYVLGIEAAEKKNYKKAITYYKRALEHYPTEDKYHRNETLNNLGNVYYHQKDYKAAKDAWEKALVLLPSDRMVIGNLINCIYENPEVPSELKEMSPFMRKFLNTP